MPACTACATPLPPGASSHQAFALAEAALTLRAAAIWRELDILEACVACLGALNAYHGVDAARKKQLLMDAIVLTIFTYGPVDRVGIIRKLRMNDTLARGPDGAYSVDLTKAMRSHKSAKFHGGTVHKLPSPTWPLIDRLAQLTQFDLLHGADKYYLFHNVNTRDALRPRAFDAARRGVPQPSHPSPDDKSWHQSRAQVALAQKTC